MRCGHYLARDCAKAEPIALVVGSRPYGAIIKRQALGDIMLNKQFAIVCALEAIGYTLIDRGGMQAMAFDEIGSHGPLRRRVILV